MTHKPRIWIADNPIDADSPGLKEALDARHQSRLTDLENKRKWEDMLSDAEVSGKEAFPGESDYFEGSDSPFLPNGSPNTNYSGTTYSYIEHPKEK